MDDGVGPHPARHARGMTTTVKAADAAQFLSLIPRMLGYTPTRSLVVVPMRRGRSLGAMRLDLPPREAMVDDGFAATVIGMVCRVEVADGLVVVVYSDAPTGEGLPHRDLVDGLRRTADASGLDLIDALVVAADGWGSQRVGPARVRALSELVAHPLPGGPDAGAGLPEVHGDQSTGAQLPERSAADRRRVGAAHRSLSAALSVLCGLPPESPRADRVDPAALAAACELDDLPQLYERALQWDPDTLSPLQAALLGWCLSRPALRDVALVQWASDAAGGAGAMDAQRRWEDGEEYPADLAAVMWGEGASPDPARLESALALVRQVAALTAAGRRAGPLAVCGWLSWALGRSTHAAHYADAALDGDREHGLADIVRSFVASAHLPDWAFRRGEDDDPSARRTGPTSPAGRGSSRGSRGR